MERLTNKREADAQREEYERRLANGYPRNIPEERFLSLAAYEDTGLTPESVEALKLSMMGKAIAEIKEFNGLPVDRLRELAEADKDGRVVVLPCKVGSTVYTEFCDEIVEKRIGQFRVNSYTEPRLWADIDCDWTSTQCVRWDLAVGKTVFLTREEAEKALEAKK